MLAIRSEQFEILAQYARERFEHRVFKSVRAIWGETIAGLEPAALRQIISDGVEAAGKYDVVEEQDVARYINLLFAVSPEFDKLPWASEILNDENLDGHTKVQQLLASAVKELETQEDMTKKGA